MDEVNIQVLLRTKLEELMRTQTELINMLKNVQNNDNIGYKNKETIKKNE